MISDVITINEGGFERAVKETRKAAAYRGLNPQETLRLELCAEEMLSLARGAAGEMKAVFWLEGKSDRFVLHLNTEAVMGREKRYLLISSATSRRNEAAGSFLGRLRNAFDEAAAAGKDRSRTSGGPAAESEREGMDLLWDRYERSILEKTSDDVKISVRGRTVEIAVSVRCGI